MLRLFSILILLCSIITSSARSVWDRDHLAQVKQQLHRDVYAMAYHRLIAEADSLLNVKALSVMDKSVTAASGNKHDYVSLARYFHPDPTKTDGLPYVNRDGIVNPEILLYDRNSLGVTAERIAILSLAWYLSDNEVYASKAAELLRTWFLNPATRMNPHFEYSQMIPGVNGGKGRCYGVLDGYSMVEMLEGVYMLDGSKSWGKKDSKQLKKWMSRLLDWILTSPQGIEESNQLNNHATAYDAQAIALALYTGRHDVAMNILNRFAERRIFTQVEPDGMQPHEMWRTLSWGYSQYNLTHYLDVFMLGNRIGLRIDKSESEDGRSFYRALDCLARYIGRPDSWPGKQIAQWEEKETELLRDLYVTATSIDTTRHDYIELYRSNRIFRPEERFNLLYYRPTVSDDIYAYATAQMRIACCDAEQAIRLPQNAAQRRVSPRTINASGEMVVVHPHDWTSGFFAGNLWMLYEYTHDPYWRRQAIAYTWPIQEAQWHKGTHDLGFMMDDSFGKAWRLTGEQSYRDVVSQSARTLISRYSPAVGLIRSWDHNAEVWKYPVIIDNMMNLEMLFKETQLTGDSTYWDIAVTHADNTLRNHFRSDGSCYHVVDYDPTDGSVRMRVTAQGYADSSHWSRGQAWAVYGYTMCYRYTSDYRYLAHARKVADWFLSLPNMPADGIPYWDMKVPGTERNDNPDVPRDASAAAVIASALYELSQYVDTATAQKYRTEADRIVDNLTEHYRAAPGTNHGFLLLHSTGHLPANSEIDVPLVYADYYYLEAASRRSH